MSNQELGTRLESLEAAVTDDRNTLRDLQFQVADLKASVDRALLDLVSKVDSLLTNKNGNGITLANPFSTPISNTSIHSPTSSYLSLVAAAREGDAQALLGMLQAGADICQRNRIGNTALHAAARRGHELAVIVLLDWGAPVNVRGQWKRSPLHFAVEKGHMGVVRRLLDKEALVDDKDADGATALMIAVQKNHHEILRVLLSRSGKPSDEEMVKYLARCEETALILIFEEKFPGLLKEGIVNAWISAAKDGRRESLRALLDAGVDINSRDSECNTALIWTSTNGHKDCVQFLVERGAHLDLSTREGRSALHQASINGNEECVRLLLEMGSDASLKDNNGQTPFDIAGTDAVRKNFS